MSEHSEAERTEEATPRRRDDAREEGRIPRSNELTIAGSLLGSALVLSALTPVVGHSLFELLGRSLSNLATAKTMDGASAVLMIRDMAWRSFSASIAMIAAFTLGGGVLAALQARGTLSLKPLMPQWGRINPGANFKNMVGARPVFELVKNLGKVAIVGAVVWSAAKNMLPEAIALSQQSQLGFLMVVKTYAVKLLATAGGAYLAIAGLDYGWQWWQHEKSLRMTKEEVKQESKQNDGDPHVKQRRRSLARSYARRQMMKDVPKADVVITNPTHIAVAIKYDPDVAPAPIVLAIGMNKVAERIKEIARQHGVPMVENRPLARSLLKTARVGTLIPYELYMAVAEVLAFVLRTKRDKGVLDRRLAP